MAALCWTTRLIAEVLLPQVVLKRVGCVVVIAAAAASCGDERGLAEASSPLQFNVLSSQIKF